MNTDFIKGLEFVLRWEGGYVNHPSDPGGATNMGITQKTYDAWLRSKGMTPRDVKDIPDADVASIYKTEYWDVCGAGQLPAPLDLLHFDAAVNHGPGRAAQFLRAAGRSPSKYLDTRTAFYHQLVGKNAKMGVFLKGWLKRVDSLRKAA